MGRNYNLDPGYVTVPEASEIVKRLLGIVNKEDKSHYNQILKGAKKGWYGGKMHGKRMYQVRKEDIIKYAEELLAAEKIRLLHIEIAGSDTIEKMRRLPDIDQETAKKLYIYLRLLRLNEIISSEIHEEAEKKLMLRMNMSRVAGV